MSSSPNTNMTNHAAVEAPESATPTVATATTLDSSGAAPSRIGRRFWISFLLVVLVVAAFISFYASGSPDGLEYVAGQLGFEQHATDTPAGASPLADYGVAGIDNARLSGGLAGVIGTIAVLGITLALARLLRPKSI